MSNINNKQPLDLTDYDGISLVERWSRDVNAREKDDSWSIPGINSDEASTTTPISDPMGFLLSCAEKGGARVKQRLPTICKVSRALRDLSESSFTPQLVSIGPIHREDPKLKEFEWLKECYLHDLLKRCSYIYSTTEKTLLEASLEQVNTLIPRIRECYAGVIEKYSDDQVATMMVMDGCFILEFCFKHRYGDWDLSNKMQILRIARDLLLLENQVPFFFLQALFGCTMGEVLFTLSDVLDEYLESFTMIFRSCSRSVLPEITIHFDSDSTHDHVLGYLHKRYQLVAEESKLVAAKSSDTIHALKSKLVAAKLLNLIHALKSKLVAAKLLNPKRALKSKLVDENGLEYLHTAFHSIVEMDRSGINFKPHQEDEWSMTIKFQSSLFAYLPWFKPTLLMPTLVIHDGTELVLRNLITYEQSFPNKGYKFTSYAYAMDMLIDTQEDILKLVESKVLVNMLGSNQEAADMINKICKNIILTEFCYIKEFKEIDKYYNGYWPKNIARLRRVYFNNPWSAMALVAAIILFSLTVVQTVYTIRAA